MHTNTVPNLSVTPSLPLTAPDDFAEVNKCLNAVEGRVSNESKMEELRLLKDKMYTYREEPFHWNFHDAIEINCDFRPRVPSDEGRGGLDTDMEITVEDMEILVL